MGATLTATQGVAGRLTTRGFGMVKSIARMLVLGLVALVVPLVGGLHHPASAAVCTWNWIGVGQWGSGSGTTQVAATNTCNNMWAVRTWAYNDWVRGQYKKNGVWTWSIEGEKFVSADGGSDAKIVASLVDGEPLRAWNRKYTQGVRLGY